MSIVAAKGPVQRHRRGLLRCTGRVAMCQRKAKRLRRGWWQGRARSCDHKEMDPSFLVAAPVLAYISCMLGIEPYAGGGGDNARRAEREHDVVAARSNAALPEGRDDCGGPALNAVVNESPSGLVVKARHASGVREARCER